MRRPLYARCMAHALVLGGGGLVGIGYHAGALKALDESGVDVRAADLMVGTSAGAVVAAYLASDSSPAYLYDWALGRFTRPEEDDLGKLFSPLWTSPQERARRTVGSFFAAASSRGLWRSGVAGRVPSSRWRRAFPSGMYSMEGTKARLRMDLPRDWPRQSLLLTAADLYSGERMIFSKTATPSLAFPDAVLASIAIPGVFPPVRVGNRHYVDGGIISTTSLDVAADAGCDTVICIAPLGYSSDVAWTARDRKMWPAMLARSLFARALERELREVKGKGVHVLVIRPGVTELRVLGFNAMKQHDRVAVTEAAREGTLRWLQENRAHPALVAARGQKTA